MIRPSSIIAASLAFALATVAPARAEDLLQVYREAQQNDPTLAAARANWEATQERVPAGARRAAAQREPVRQHECQLLRHERRHRSARADRPRIRLGGLTVSASQPLYRYANTVAYGQAVQQVEQADYTLASARQDLILRVATAYFDVLLAQFNVELAESQKAAVSEQLAQAKRNFEVGVATITDTNEAQAKYDSIVAQEISARNDLDNKRTALRAIIGRFPQDLKRLGPGLRADAAVAQFARLVGRSRARRQPQRPHRAVQRRDRHARDRAPARRPPADARSRRERERAGRTGVDQPRRLQRFAPGADRPRTQRAALPGRLRRFEGPRGDRAAGKRAAESRGRAPQRAVQRADGIHAASTARRRR